MSNNSYETLQKNIQNSNISEIEKIKLFKNFIKSKSYKINLMITGATGVGKSSTINALFGYELAKIGVGVDPETMDIKKYEMDNLVLWDTPGLGDGKESDVQHSKKIISKLYETDSNGDLLIDFVLVVLDASSRDLGTSYNLINNIIIPNLGQQPENKILVAINQADVAKKSNNWNFDENKPDETLKKFLDEKVVSVKNRIYEATNLKVEPIYYKAGYKEDFSKQEEPYNISQLLNYIIKLMPTKKRKFEIIEAETTKTNSTRSYDYDNSYSTNILEDIVDTISDVGWGIYDTVTSGCYITTAVCCYYNKPDDCYELTAFRNFRDNWLLNQSDGKDLIKKYYETAPIIVEKINKQINEAEIYINLNNTYLLKCLNFIENNENEKCKETYIDMMNYLYIESNKWN